MSRVSSLKAIKGLMEYRFVPKDWTPPKAFADHVDWFVFDPDKHADEYEKIRVDMVGRAERLKNFNGNDWDGVARWYNKSGVYAAKVTYDPVERPFLVLIGVAV